MGGLLKQILNFKKNKNSFNKEEEEVIKKKMLKECDASITKTEKLLIEVIDYIIDEI